ncbi:phospholipase [Niveomyces insectorum RCEF 264]|uniref:Phospholipase n=1 Tax=Niveomyces insectorum RCEF 264 TaxID=1081102 RepID=A0A167YYC1_9HYPO|nr:phospholipase [Niveomyces insectorum RCEF 264]
MKLHEHPRWLGCLLRANGADIVCSDRLQRIIGSLADADAQCPSLVLLVGSPHETAAVRSSFGIKRCRWPHTKHGWGDVYLYVASDLVHGGLAQLFLPLSDVVYIFCQDLGGLPGPARRLAAWMDQTASLGSRVDEPVRPELLLVADGLPVGIASEALARQSMLSQLRKHTTKNILDYVAAVRVLVLWPRGVLSPASRFRPLKEELLQASDRAQRRRRDAGHLFSATHFALGPGRQSPSRSTCPVFDSMEPGACI